MRRLVIDTATPNLTVALFEDDVLLAHHHGPVGRGHAELLVPAIADLPDGGRADAIWVGCGPGSFTGLRIGIAAARALAFAWNAQLRGFNSLELIAAHARRISGDDAVAIAVDGGHGEWLVAQWDDDGTGNVQSLPPAMAVAAVSSPLVAGLRAAELVALRGWGTAIDAQADAREALGLDQTLLQTVVTPIYTRPPDAKPTKAAVI